MTSAPLLWKPLRMKFSQKLCIMLPSQKEAQLPHFYFTLYFKQKKLTLCQFSLKYDSAVFWEKKIPRKQNFLSFVLQCNILYLPDYLL